jgi:RNA polymerase sigma-70 factor (ECF subfamily)
VTDETSDEALAASAAAGDAEAFRALYVRYRTMVFTLALRTLGNEQDAEDALQQAFLRVHRALPGFRGESKLSTWIWQVAASVALSQRRRRRPPAAALDELGEEEPQAADAAPDAAAVADDDAALLRRHLAALPRRDRAILHMRYSEGRSFEEIGRMLGMPVGTAKSLVFRAKAELRRNMEREGHAM